MPLMKTKPTSPGRRSMVKVVNPDLHKGKPFAALSHSFKKLAVIIMVISLLVTRVAVINTIIG